MVVGPVGRDLSDLRRALSLFNNRSESPGVATFLKFISRPPLGGRIFLFSVLRKFSVVMRQNRLSDPKRFVADPDPTIYADADPDWNFL